MARGSGVSPEGIPERPAPALLRKHPAESPPPPRARGGGPHPVAKSSPRPATRTVSSRVFLPIEPRKPYGIQKLRDTWIVREATRASMRANRSKETGPEVRLRKALWAAGMRGYRKNRRTLPGTPDVAYGRTRLAVFVHGCFWHGHDLHVRPAPKTNAAYWAAKIAQNRERDARHRLALEAMGWRVMVLWECEVIPARLGEAVERVREALGPSAA